MATRMLKAVTSSKKGY